MSGSGAEEMGVGAGSVAVAFELIEDPADVGVTMMLDWVERLDLEAVELREVDPAVVERGST
jgi:hypothetical protein